MHAVITQSNNQHQAHSSGWMLIEIPQFSWRRRKAPNFSYSSYLELVLNVNFSSSSKQNDDRPYMFLSVAYLSHNLHIKDYLNKMCFPYNKSNKHSPCGDSLWPRVCMMFCHIAVLSYPSAYWVETQSSSL
jgi:hypothetical protein